MQTSNLPVDTLLIDSKGVVKPVSTQTEIIKPTTGNSCSTLKVELERSVVTRTKVHRIRQATRRRPTATARPDYSPLSLATSAKDRLGILDKVSPHGLEYRQTRRLLTSPVDPDTYVDTLKYILWIRELTPLDEDCTAQAPKHQDFGQIRRVDTVVAIKRSDSV